MNTFPAQLARELDAETVLPLKPGGDSPARLWKVTAGKDVLAVKVLQRGAGMIDGHDTQSFLQKPAQIQRLHRELPHLSPFYVDVVGVWDHPDWAAYAMPFVDGGAAVTPQSPPGLVCDRLGLVFGVLTEHGYGRTRGSRALAQLRDLHLGRIRRRLWVLERHVRRELLDGPPILVNGRRCRPLGQLLQAIESNTALVNLLRPGVVSYPVHGDLGLGNVRERPGHPESFTVIGPVGTRAYRDPIYDFAKALFSMTIFDRAMASGLRIWRLPGRGRQPTSYIIRAVDAYREYSAMALPFVDMLASLPFGEELERTDPHWRLRLAFSQGFHALAEAGRHLTAPAPEPRRAGGRDPVTLTTGLCGLGLRLLEQAIAAARRSSTDLPDISTQLDEDTAVIWRH